MCDKKLKITNLFLGSKKKGFVKFWKKKKIETKKIKQILLNKTFFFFDELNKTLESTFYNMFN